MTVGIQDTVGNQILADTTSKGMIVQNPKVVTQAGFTGVVAIRDQGTITGAPNIGMLDITNNRRLRVSLDTPLFQDQFNYIAQNTAMWKYITSTMTTTWQAAGGMWINGGASVASGAYTTLNTYRSFPMYTAGELVWEIRGYYTQVPQANNAHWMGICTVPGTTAAPTDGVFFELDATGIMRGVCATNGTRSVTANFPSVPSNNIEHDWQIVIDDGLVEFWIDNILYGSVLPAAAAGTPNLNGAGYAFHQMYNSAAVTTAQMFKVFNMQVTLYGINTNKPWPHIKSSEGLNASQGQNGGTMGNTALYVNNTAPTAAIPTNTTAALGSGLGGSFYETMSIAVTTDGIISSYQNPAGSINITPRNLYITGIRWSSMVQTVAAGGPFIYECGLAYGHTAVSLATTDTATTKSPRRFPLGLFTLAATAPVGSVGAQFVHTFATPLFVQPGEFVQTILRNIGTVGTAGVQAHMIAIEGYWE